MASGPITIGLAQINNSFSGANYLPYAAGLLQGYLERYASDPGRYRFLMPLYKRIPVREAVEAFADADVVGFSLYVWNYELSRAILRELKARKPSLLVVCGGPHVPDRAEDFLRENPFVDVAVHGEGEDAFLRLMESWPAGDWRATPGISFIDAEGNFVTNPKAARLRELSAVPSPYLSGTFDRLMAEHTGGEWLALWETNRGCPFQCTFCDWGSATQAKVVQFDMDRLKAEAQWFADRRIEFIFCCDANFGILPRDIDIVRYVADIKARTGYPQALSVQNTKNATDRAYLTQKILADAGLNKGVTLSMQTLDQTTLKNIKRQNIDLATYEELQRRFTQDGVVTYSDLILGLPGETYDTFTAAVSTLIENGQHNRIQFNNLSVLPNAEMGDPAYQRKFGMELVKSRILNIHGSLTTDSDDIAEVQDLVVATASTPPEDWRRTRAFAWMTAFLHFDKILQIPLILTHESTHVPYRDLIEAFMAVESVSSPTVAWIRDHFLARAAEIQAGGPEYQHSAEWLNIYWPDDEYVYIKLTVDGAWDTFYAEARLLLESFVRQRAPDALDLLDDALRLNRALLKQPFVTKDEEIEIGSNMAEFHRGVLVGSPVAIERRPHRYLIDRTTDTWPTLDRWCKEVVWFGNKKGAYLYGTKAMEKYYAGHY